MKKMIPLNKMSKKQQAEIHRSKRGSWNGVVPVTRIKEDGKKYKRCRKQRPDDLMD